MISKHYHSVRRVRCHRTKQNHLRMGGVIKAVRFDIFRRYSAAMNDSRQYLYSPYGKQDQWNQLKAMGKVQRSGFSYPDDHICYQGPTSEETIYSSGQSTPRGWHGKMQDLGRFLIIDRS